MSRRHQILRVFLIATVLLCNVSIQAHAKRAKTQAGATQSAPPVPVVLGKALVGSDLRRIVVGNQAGVLKIIGPDHTVLFAKDAPNTDIKSLDYVLFMPLTEDNRKSILTALRIGDDEINEVAAAIMLQYQKLPHRQSLALLGVLDSIADSRLSASTALQMRRFLCVQLQANKDRSLHRQAVLALAVANAVDEVTVAAVIDFMKGNYNAWETFTTQAFFDCHHDAIIAMPSRNELIERLAASGNPYADPIVQRFRASSTRP